MLKARKRLVTVIFFLCGALSFGFAVNLPADDSSNINTPAPAGAAVIDSSADGPHVFWRDDSACIVIYLCHDSLIKQVYEPSDTLRFTGFCYDSAVEYVIAAGPKTADPYDYADVSRILALSDIHGEYEELVEFLYNNAVVDENRSWIWGDGHLVIAGDIFDRGDKVTECLWLIYRLEKQAEKAGGRVHFLLGNHELMVLRGDDRYINEKYTGGIVKKSRIAHKDLFGPDMELGRWLRSRNTAIRINDIIFVHGGLSKYLVDSNYDLPKINTSVRENLDLRSSQLAFNDDIKFLFGSKGPFWYRGYHFEIEGAYSKATPEDITEILSYFDAEGVVVGHTEVDQVSDLFDGRIRAIDVPVEELGGFQGLLWEDGRFSRVSEAGEIQPLE